MANAVKVDPYTPITALAAKPDDIAWVTFSGRLGINAVMAVFVPGSMLGAWPITCGRSLGRATGRT